MIRRAGRRARQWPAADEANRISQTLLSGALLLAAFLDTDGDGLRDPGEPLFPTTARATNSPNNTPVSLLNLRDGIPTPDGLLFTDLSPGTWRVGFIVPVFFNTIARVGVEPGETTILEVPLAPAEPLLLEVPQGGFGLVGTVGGRNIDVSFTTPGNGTLLTGEIGRGGGSLYYVPDADFAGQDSFALLNQFVFDLPGPPTPVEITVTSRPPAPDRPLAVDDGGFRVAMGGELGISFEQLLANDQGEGLSLFGLTTDGTQNGVEMSEQGQVIAVYGGQTAGRFNFFYGIADAQGRADIGMVSVEVFNPSLPGGTAGNDTIAGTPGNDRIEGLAGDDLLSGGAGNDLMLGGEGRDTQRGGPGQDSLQGGAGDDAMDGGDGFDQLDGGPGADRLRGGQNNDLFLLRRGEIADPSLNGGQFDHIIDFELNGPGQFDFGDNLRLDGFGAGATLAYLRDLGGRSNLHIYEVSDGEYSAAFIVQIAGDGSERLGLRDYQFAF